MSRLIGLCVLLAACATDSVAVSDLTIENRFVLVALRNDDGSPKTELTKWEGPIRVQITGSQRYRDQVASHLALLEELTSLTTEMDANWPNMIIDFSLREKDWWCFVSVSGQAGRLSANISIRTDQSQHNIQRCIVQEMTQALGLLEDTDGRRDTAFSSAIGTDHLTELDRQLLAILYDNRLKDGMPRDDVLTLLPTIVADISDKIELR